MNTNDKKDLFDITIQKWCDYFGYLYELKVWENKVMDDESLHIGFREDDE